MPLTVGGGGGGTPVGQATPQRDPAAALCKGMDVQGSFWVTSDGSMPWQAGDMGRSIQRKLSYPPPPQVMHWKGGGGGDSPSRAPSRCPATV